jgi:hypothetical protein
VASLLAEKFCEIPPADEQQDGGGRALPEPPATPLVTEG